MKVCECFKVHGLVLAPMHAIGSFTRWIFNIVSYSPLCSSWPSELGRFCPRLIAQHAFLGVGVPVVVNNRAG